MILFRYQLLLLILTPIMLLFTAYQAIKHRDRRYFLQRLGLSIPYFRKSVWIHAASVGEVLAAKPLALALLSRHPDYTLVISTVTPTGAGIAAKFKGIEHVYLPMDWPLSIRATLNAIHPRVLIIMETELWPNLFRLCKHNDTPIIIVNGRLSDKTLHTRGWVRALLSHTIQQSTMILARSQTDRQHFLDMGASVESTQNLGNIKYCLNIETGKTIEHPLVNRRYVLAASTHDDEELQIATVWTELSLNPATLLAIAPRHPQRLDDILKQLQPLKLDIAIRSRNDPVSDQTQLYIIDTLGELMAFMQNALVVIMGGSFVPVGGHNVLESAALGKPVIFGPHMHNFADEAAELLQHNAALRANDCRHLKDLLTLLLTQAPVRDELGQQAQTFFNAQQGILQHYIAEIEKILNAA